MMAYLKICLKMTEKDWKNKREEDNKNNQIGKNKLMMNFRN